MLKMHLTIKPFCGLQKKLVISAWFIPYFCVYHNSTNKADAKKKSCLLVISEKRSSHTITSNKWCLQITAGALFCHSTKKSSVWIRVIEQILPSLTAYWQTTCLSFDKFNYVYIFHLNKCGYFISSVLQNSLRSSSPSLLGNNSAKRNLQ